MLSILTWAREYSIKILDLNMQKHLQQKSHSPGNKGQSVPTLMRHCETNFVFFDKFDNQDEIEIN